MSEGDIETSVSSLMLCLSDSQPYEIAQATTHPRRTGKPGGLVNIRGDTTHPVGTEKPVVLVNNGGRGHYTPWAKRKSWWTR